MTAQTQNTTTVETGVYDDMSYADYAAIDAVRATQLKPYKISARRGRHAELNQLSGRFLDVGNAIHTLVLEPDEFEKRYAVLGPCEAEIKSGARKGEACGLSGTVEVNGQSFCGKHGKATGGGPFCLKLDEYKTAMNIIGALDQRPDIRQHLDAPSHTERVLVWNDPDLGVLCKCRIDRQTIEDGTIVDLKTTAAPDLSARTVMGISHKLGYHNSLAWYRRGCRVLGIDVAAVLIVWLQTTADNDVAAYWLDDDALDQGESEMMSAAECMLQARSTGHYPGVQTDCRNAIIGLPEWAQDELELIHEGTEQ